MPCKNQNRFSQMIEDSLFVCLFFEDNNLVDFSMILTLVQNLGWDRKAEEESMVEAFAGKPMSVSQALHQVLRCLSAQFFL